MSSTKEQLSYGWAYVFRHRELGQLGRVVLQGRPDGQCHVTCETSGDPDDPMSAKRHAIFAPLATDLVRRLEAQTSRTGGGGVTPPPRPPEPKQSVASQLMPCPTFHAGVALLIFAETAADRGGLEDDARLMYPQVKEVNLPTSVVGPPVGDAPLPDRPADILKIWPEREPVRRMRPADFNPVIEALARAHCG